MSACLVKNIDLCKLDLQAPQSLDLGPQREARMDPKFCKPKIRVLLVFVGKPPVILRGLPLVFTNLDDAV